MLGQRNSILKNQGQTEIISIRSPCTLKVVSLIIQVYNKTIKKLLHALLCLPNLCPLKPLAEGDYDKPIQLS